MTCALSRGEWWQYPDDCRVLTFSALLFAVLYQTWSGYSNDNRVWIGLWNG